MAGMQEAPPHQEAHAVENPPKVGVARLLGLAKPNPKVAAQSEMDSSGSVAVSRSPDKGLTPALVLSLPAPHPHHARFREI